MSSRKRSGSGSKRPKEKVVYIYEMLFRTDFEDPIKNNNDEFWNEFFLLQPNIEALESELTKLSSEQLQGLKKNINLLFTQSIDLLDSGEVVVDRGVLCMFRTPFPLQLISLLLLLFYLFADHPKRVCNSLQTLCALFYGIFKRNASETAGFDVISTIFDFQEIEDKMKHLIAKCNDLLISEC